MVEKKKVEEWIVGASCVVKLGKKSYSGRLAAWGELVYRLVGHIASATCMWARGIILEVMLL